MRIRISRNPTKKETYLCSKKDIRLCFEDIDKLDVVFGLRDIFRFDSRCFNHPQINGIAVVSATINRQLEPSIYLYNASLDQVTEKVRMDFVERILVNIKKWLTEQLQKNETEILGIEELVIELQNGNFIEHKVRFL